MPSHRVSSPLREGDWHACGVLPWARGFPASSPPSLPHSHVHHLARKARRLRAAAEVCSIVGSRGSALTSLWFTWTWVLVGSSDLVKNPSPGCVGV